MPKELVGVWETAHEPYRDQYLMVTPLDVRFGIDENTMAVHQVVEVRSIGEPNEKVYRISYLSAETEDQEYWLVLRYERGDQTLRLVNQPQMAWKRKRSFN